MTKNGQLGGGRADLPGRARRVINRSSDAITRADWDQCRSVFAPDAVWEAPALGMRFEGAAHS
jgi:hypothetical protein